MNWVYALRRLRATNPQATLGPLLASLRPGQQILFVRPLTEGAKNWQAAWTQLVRLRSAQMGAILGNDPHLRVVWLAPHNYQGACCVGNSAILYEKVS
jgi:mannosyltransferase